MRAQVVDLVERLFGRSRFSGQSNITLRCPLHKGGREATPSFSVNVEMGFFHCFTCGVSGTLPYLLKLVGFSKEEVDAELGDLGRLIKENRLRYLVRKDAEWVFKDPYRAHTRLRESILKAYYHCPTKLTQLGFDAGVLEAMEVGYDFQNDRITYPVRDIYGGLAGLVGGSQYAAQQPKYKVYLGTRKDHVGRVSKGDYGEWFDEEYPEYEFRNHDYLWNFERIYPRLFFRKEPNQFIIIVEGFKACLWCVQHGYWNTVALMGDHASAKQLALLKRLDVSFLVFLDNNEPGRQGTKKVASELYKTTSGVYIVEYPYGSDESWQPDDFEPPDLIQAVSNARHYPQVRRNP